MSCCCSSKPRFVVDPALLGDLETCCSAYTVEEAADGTITITMDPGDGGAPTVAEIPPGCCGEFAVETGADDSITITMDPGDGSGPVVAVIPPGGGGATSVVTDNGDGTFTHDDGAGNTVTWGAGTTSSVTFDPDTGEYTHDDGNGNTISWGAEECEFSSCCTAADGVAVIIKVIDGAVTYTTAGGAAWAGDPATLDCPTPGGSGPAGADGADGTASILTPNADGSFTHDDGTGTTVDIPAPVPHVPSSLTANADGSFTHDDGTGATTDIPAPIPTAPSSVTDNGDGTFTHDDGLGNTTVWGEPCEPATCGTAPDGSTVIITLVGGVPVYTTASGAPWTGNPGDLS